MKELSLIKYRRLVSEPRAGALAKQFVNVSFPGSVELDLKFIAANDIHRSSPKHLICSEHYAIYWFKTKPAISEIEAGWLDVEDTYYLASNYDEDGIVVSRLTETDWPVYFFSGSQGGGWHFLSSSIDVFAETILNIRQ